MAKKYFNGFKPCSFIIDSEEAKTLSVWQNTCKEYYEPYWVEVMDIGGVKYQKFLFLHLHWLVDLEKGAPPADVKIIKNVLNAEKLAKQIFLTPYSEYSIRRFEVFSDKSVMEYSALPGGEASEGMQGIKRKFSTRYPLYAWDLLDLNEADLMLAPTGEGIDNII